MRYMFGFVTLLIATSAQAAPGVGEKVYGASVERNVTELEMRYGRVSGRNGPAEEAMILEAARGFNDHLYGAFLTRFGRDAGGGRRLESVALEGIYALGRIAPLDVDVALYGEYEHGLHGPDRVETKLLLQHVKGRFDGRLNLIAERALQGRNPVGLGYAASADWEVANEFRLGATAIGDVGDTLRFTTRSEHFAGPVTKYNIEHLAGGELGVEGGYLFALGRARDNADGQIRLLLEYEAKF